MTQRRVSLTQALGPSSVSLIVKPTPQRSCRTHISRFRLSASSTLSWRQHRLIRAA